MCHNNNIVVLKKYNETLISYKGQKELLDYQHKERISKLEQLKAEISDIVNEIKELTTIRYKNINSDEENREKLSKIEIQTKEQQNYIANWDILKINFSDHVL